MKGSANKGASDTVATNRKARRDYHILETLEAGIELLGGEVKSIRAGDASLNESYARFENGQGFLVGCHIKPYACSRQAELDPVRPRRLLLHRREIDRIAGQVAIKGHTLAPLRLYLDRRGMVKVELALCRGKQAEDKRDALRRKTADLEAARAMRRHGD